MTGSGRYVYGKCLKQSKFQKAVSIQDTEIDTQFFCNDVVTITCRDIEFFFRRWRHIFLAGSKIKGGEQCTWTDGTVFLETLIGWSLTNWCEVKRKDLIEMRIVLVCQIVLWGLVKQSMTRERPVWRALLLTRIQFTCWSRQFWKDTDQCLWATVTFNWSLAGDKWWKSSYKVIPRYKWKIGRPLQLWGCPSACQGMNDITPETWLEKMRFLHISMNIVRELLINASTEGVLQKGVNMVPANVLWYFCCTGAHFRAKRAFGALSMVLVQTVHV